MRLDNKKEILALTGIRGIAAIWVLLFHFCGSLTILLPVFKCLHPLALHGYLGVDIFFVLSGFIMSYVYDSLTFDVHLRSYGHFLWNRFSRIYPNHLVTLMALWLFVVVARLCGVVVSGDYPVGKLPVQLLLLHAWPYIDGGLWNYPSWSISAEWFAYMFVFPVGVIAIQRNFTRTHPVLLLTLPVAAYFLLSHSLFSAHIYHALLSVTCEFSAGMSAYLLFHNHAASVVRFSRLLPALLVLLLGLFFSPWSAWSDVCTICAAPLIILGLADSHNGVARCLGSRPLLWLGRISYSLYMSHALAQKILKSLVPAEHFAQAPLVARMTLFALYFVVPILGAALLYYACEIPAQRWLRNLLGPREGVR